jgi:hypothetical protein
VREDGRRVSQRAVSCSAGDERFASGVVVRATMALTLALDETRAFRPASASRLSDATTMVAMVPYDDPPIFSPRTES